MSKSTFPYVDILKFLFAIGVVLEHSFVGYIDNGLYAFWNACIIRLSIPFFFVASGFFLGRKIYSKSNISSTGGYCKRLFLKLAVFEPVAIILNIITYLLNGTDFIEIVLLTGRSVLFYPWGALWYIQATITAVLILTPLIRMNKEWTAIPVGVIFYGFALLCNRYYFVVADTPFKNVVYWHNRIFSGPRNGLLYGLLFVAIGLLISKHWDKISNKKLQFAVGLIISYSLLVCEFFLIRGKQGTEDASLHIMMIFVCPMLFITAAQYSYFPIETKPVRNLSTSIYLLHSPLISILNIFGLLTTGEKLSCLMLNLMLFTILTILIAIVYRTKKEPFYKLII